MITTINDSETDINTTAPNNGVKLQTEVSTKTKNYLRMEAVRRHLTMGQLIDEIVQMFGQDVPKSTS